MTDGARILMVEDDPLLQEILAEVLRGEGYSVEADLILPKPFEQKKLLEQVAQILGSQGA